MAHGMTLASSCSSPPKPPPLPPPPTSRDAFTAVKEKANFPALDGSKAGWFQVYTLSCWRKSHNKVLRLDGAVGRLWEVSGDTPFLLNVRGWAEGEGCVSESQFLRRK